MSSYNPKDFKYYPTREEVEYMQGSSKSDSTDSNKKKDYISIIEEKLDMYLIPDVAKIVSSYLKYDPCYVCSSFVCDQSDTYKIVSFMHKPWARLSCVYKKKVCLDCYNIMGKTSFDLRKHNTLAEHPYAGVFHNRRVYLPWKHDGYPNGFYDSYGFSDTED
jgi:hypothetical protein